ncbi:PREDICTED: peptidoglycan-recognition protein LC-like isoform X1 [Papilio polytes]|uniref:peptidoglycan-recognition protein LC-like isoform X1 n=1 Tax=Papilio polytes TaxID=76194 RepID=UPI000675FD27|nr:PREDICTED: peptidoglycan-recognition protein LC-like isoform X1 [Papilio polytes]
MAMKSVLNNSSNSGLKVEGDIGDVQIIEEVSDDDSDYDKQTKLSTTNFTPKSLGLLPSTSPVIGTVSVANSENVHFGNNTFFNGPVTIIQNKNGVENASYTNTEDKNVEKDECQNKPQCAPTIKKHDILTKQKLIIFVICIIIVGGIVTIVLITMSKKDGQSSGTSTSFNDAYSANEVEGLGYDTLYTIFHIIIISLTFVLVLYIGKSLKIISDNTDEKKCKNKTNKSLIKTKCDMCMNCYFRVDPLLIAPDHLRIVSRTDWLAQPVEGPLDKIVQPVPWVIITHTATESCYIQSQCVLAVRLIQSFHIESRKWFDIGYNFLVGGDGSVYFGRGWNYIGAHTKGYNKYSIAIAFIGTFNNEPPPKQQIDACKKLIKHGVEIGVITKDYKLFAHRQLMSTLSPGDKLFDIIKEWPHFVSNLTDVDNLIPKGY